MLENIIEFLIDNQTIFLWGITVIGIPAIFAWWQISHGKKIAIESGVYKKPIMEINAIFKHFRKSSYFSAYVGIDFRKEYQFTVLHIPFYFNNRGDKSLEDVSFILEFSSDSTLPIEKLYQNDSELHSKRVFIKTEDSISIHYKIGDMYPEIGCLHHEILMLKKERKKTLEKFSVIMMAKDQLPITVDINLNIVESNKIEDIIQKAINDSLCVDNNLSYNYITAIPKSKSIKMQTGYYQESIIKESHLPIKPNKKTTFVPNKADNAI